MFAGHPMWGQTIDELQKEIQEAENAIKRSNELLEENKSQQKVDSHNFHWLNPI